jgi:hypothetical protein
VELSQEDRLPAVSTRSRCQWEGQVVDLKSNSRSSHAFHVQTTDPAAEVEQTNGNAWTSVNIGQGSRARGLQKEWEAREVREVADLSDTCPSHKEEKKWKEWEGGPLKADLACLSPERLGVLARAALRAVPPEAVELSPMHWRALFEAGAALVLREVPDEGYAVACANGFVLAEGRRRGLPEAEILTVLRALNSCGDQGRP